MTNAWMNFVAESAFERVSTVIVNQSPFNAATYRSGFDDDRYVFRFRYKAMTKAEASPLLGAIAAQRGGRGSIDVFDPDFRTGAPGTLGFNSAGIANGPGQTGQVIETVWPLGLQPVCKAGDKVWIAHTVFGPRMYTVTADVTSRADATAALPLDIPIRHPTQSAAPIQFIWGSNGIYMSARLTSSEISTDAAGLFSISITGEEIVP